MGRLRRAKSWMTWYGWTNGGGPGAVKRDAQRQEIAYHGDREWRSDVDRACNEAEREMRAEDERTRRRALSRSEEADG